MKSDSKDKQTNNYSVVYVLDVIPNTQSLGITPFVSRQRKTGGWGSPRTTSFSHLADSSAKYLTENDSQIARLLTATACRSFWSEQTTFPEQYDICQFLFASHDFATMVHYRS